MTLTVELVALLLGECLSNSAVVPIHSRDLTETQHVDPASSSQGYLWHCRTCSTSGEYPCVCSIGCHPRPPQKKLSLWVIFSLHWTLPTPTLKLIFVQSQEQCQWPCPTNWFLLKVLHWIAEECLKIIIFIYFWVTLYTPLATITLFLFLSQFSPKRHWRVDCKVEPSCSSHRVLSQKRESAIVTYQAVWGYPVVASTLLEIVEIWKFIFCLL